jgi:DNA-directed RNA polymerase specialized sigma24 family protein
MEPLDPELLDDETSTLIIRRFAAGDDDALAKYLSHNKGRFVRSADRLIRQLEIDEADLDGEGAVDLALSKLSQAGQRKMLASIKNSDDFARLMTTVLCRVISDQKKCSEASRRGGDRAARLGGNGVGGAAVPRFTRTEADLDSFQSPLPPAEDVFIAKNELRLLLERVGEPILRTIIKMRYEGFTRKEMAQSLGVSERTIQQKLANIRDIHSHFKAKRHR